MAFVFPSIQNRSDNGAAGINRQQGDIRVKPLWGQVILEKVLLDIGSVEDAHGTLMFPGIIRDHPNGLRPGKITDERHNEIGALQPSNSLELVLRA